MKATTITGCTTLGELDALLAAFDLRAEFAPLKPDGYYEVALVDPDGIFGYARDVSIPGALSGAFEAYLFRVFHVDTAICHR